MNDAEDVMDTDASLLQVKRLLGLMPGVEVVWAQQAPSLIRLGLAVRSPTSLARLAHITFAANVLLVVEVDWGWEGDKDDPERVRYDLRVPRDQESTDPPSTLEVVGIYLARYLMECGRLASDEAIGLLRAWNSDAD
jgi:hypothetical protein